MVSYRLVGTGVTDSNGVATCNYTGSGKGEVDFVASLDNATDISESSLQSKTYEVYDCLLKELDSATYGETTSSTTQRIIKRYILNNTDYCLSAPFCFECDVESITNPTGLRLRISEQDNSPLYLTTSLASIGVTDACHIKCVVTETNTEWFVDGISKYSATGVAENLFSIVFIQLANNVSSITIKNAIIYSI